MEYSFRKSLIEKEKTFRLLDEALEISVKGVPRTIIPYESMRRIQLVYSPNRFFTGMFS